MNLNHDRVLLIEFSTGPCFGLERISTKSFPTQVKRIFLKKKKKKINRLSILVKKFQMVLPKLKFKIQNKEAKFFLFIVDGNPLGNYHLHPPGRDNFFQCPR